MIADRESIWSFGLSQLGIYLPHAKFLFESIQLSAVEILLYFLLIFLISFMGGKRCPERIFSFFYNPTALIKIWGNFLIFVNILIMREE